MADVVGTAYVRIKALTNKLGKDIEKGFAKGAKDADVSKAGEAVGDDLVKGASKKIETDSGDSIRRSLEKAIKKGDFKKASNILAKKVSEDFNESFSHNFTTAIRKGDYEGAGKLIKRKLGLEKHANDSATGFIHAFKQRIRKSLKLDKEGRGAGGSFGKAFRGGFFAKIAKISLLLAPIVIGLSSLLVQYVTALTAQIGLLVVAIAGAGIALGSVLGAVAFGVLPLVLAFKAETAELNKFKDVASKVGEAWQEVGAATQETLLPGLREALITTPKLIPEFRAFGREIGLITGEIAHASVHVLTDDMSRFSDILKGSSTIFSNFAGILPNFLDLFLDIFKEALPVGEQFSEALNGMFERWKNLIGAAADSGRLAEVFQDWYDKAVVVFKALGDFFAAFWNIFTAGSDSALPFFDNFAKWAAEFRAFTASESGQNRLKQIFDDSLEVAHEFNGLVVDIFRRIGSAVFEEGGNEGIIGFIRTLRFDVLPILDAIIRNIRDDLGPALKDFGREVRDFFVLFSGTGGFKLGLQILSQFFKALTLVLRIPGMTKFIATMLTLVGAFKLLAALRVFSTMKLIYDGFKLLFSGAKLVVDGVGAAIRFIQGITVAQEAATVATTGLTVAQANAAVSMGLLTVAEAEAAVAAGTMAAATGTATVATAGLLTVLGPIAIAVAAVGAAFVLFKKDSDTVSEGVASAKEAFADLSRELKDSFNDVVADTFEEKDVQALGEFGIKLQEVTNSLIAGKDPIEVFDRRVKALGISSEDMALALGSVDDAAKSGNTSKYVDTVKAVEAATGLTIEKLRSLHGSFNDLVPTTQKGAKEFLNNAVALGLLTDEQRDAAIVNGDYLGAVKKVRPVMQEAAEATEEAAKTFSSAEEAVNAFKSGLDKLLDKTFSVEEATDSYADAVEDLKKQVKDNGKSLDGNTEAGRKNRESIRRLVGESAGLIQAYATAGAGSKELELRTVAAKDALEKQLIAMGFSKEEARRYASTLDEIKPVITSTVELQTQEALTKLEAFKAALLAALSPTVRFTIETLLARDDGFAKVAVTPHLGFDPDFKPPKGAHGGIFDRATNMIIGEAGREVLIPLTNPRRALQLFEQSGLGAILSEAQGHGSTSSRGPSSSRRGGVVFEEGSVQVVAQGVSASAVVDEVNYKLGWQLTTRGDR